MAHPAIEALILDFYYEGTEGMAAIYPDEFDREVPNHAIALVTTCVSLFLLLFDNL